MLPELMLGVEITKLNDWIGVLDDLEMDAVDDAHFGGNKPTLPQHSMA